MILIFKLYLRILLKRDTQNTITVISLERMIRFWAEEKTFLIEKAYDDGGDEVGGENDEPDPPIERRPIFFSRFLVVTTLSLYGIESLRVFNLITNCSSPGENCFLGLDNLLQRHSQRSGFLSRKQRSTAQLGLAPQRLHQH